MGILKGLAIFAEGKFAPSVSEEIFKSPLSGCRAAPCRSPINSNLPILHRPDLQDGRLGLGVLHLAGQDHVHQLGQGDLHHLHKLVGIGVTLAGGQILGQVAVDDLGEQGRGGGQRANVDKILGGVARFLPKLAEGSLSVILPHIVKLACGDLQGDPIQGVAVLADALK